jgi:hypothetical protein
MLLITKREAVQYLKGRDHYEELNAIGKILLKSVLKP